MEFLMPVLKNQRHERFAQEVAKGVSAIKAYKVAGYAEATAHSNAARLMDNDGIRARIDELQGKVAAKTEVTIEGLIGHAEKIRQYAMDRKVKQLAVANTALVTMAKLAGLWIEKRENTNRDADPKRMTDAEIMERWNAIRGREAVGAGDGTAHRDEGKLH
jgi:phage terminase small subunit